MSDGGSSPSAKEMNVNKHTIGRSLTAVMLGAVCAVVAAAGPAAANTKHHETTTVHEVRLPGGNVMTFQTTPHWVAVPEAKGVYVVRDEQRPSNDFFRYNNHYYVYSNGTWYRAKTWNGTYTTIDANGVPHTFRTVHRERWRMFPEGW